MKKNLLYLLVSIMSISAVNAQILNDFDANQNATFEGWPNVPTVVANPDATGINASANCAEYVRGTEQYAHAFSNLTANLDFSTNNTFELKVMSPISCTILFKLEDLAGVAAPVEISQDVTTPNVWTQLSFPFPTAQSNTYDKVVIFFDFATSTDNTFYFDDLELVSGGTVTTGTQIDLPITFEDTTVDRTVTDFGGNVTVLGADPLNAANTVAITTKTTGAETWAGTTMSTPMGLASAIPFTATSTKMTVKVYSPAAGIPVRLKVEDHLDNTHTCETETMTTMANAWETIEFDFSNEATGTAALDLSWTFDMASIFFNFDSNGAGGVYYWDDVEFSGAVNPGNQLSLPITFDDATVDYTFDNWGGNATELGIDPMNANNTVAVTTKPANAEVWAGSAVIGTTDGLPTAIPFTATETKMNLRVYAPAAGVPVLLKVEDKTDGSHSCETLGLTSVANAWETIVFDFTNNEVGTPALDLAWTYDKIAVFFDFGNTGTEGMYYWDDVTFGEFASVNENNLESVKIFPNPVKDMLNISGFEQAEQLSIFNAIGTQVMNIEISKDDLTIDMSDFTSGLYIITIYNTNGKISSYRLIKQ